MTRSAFAVSIIALALGGCASTRAPAPESGAAAAPAFAFTPNPRFEAIAEAGSKREQDRRAILAMQGEYLVKFNFEETVPLRAGYERRPQKNSGGYETVIVVQDAPDAIVLQHLLVSPGGRVIKHWRQDWTFEATERFQFVADQTWKVETMDPEQVAGAWTQCVYEVSDAPRYCGTGRWNHRYGVSTWTSDRSWRPLPRREYTTREDYNALNVENRHTVTPHGWTHEQDNTKTVRDGRDTVETLVREFGFNDYQHIEGFDFGPAYAYWNRTEEYWARVRAAWAERLAAGTLVLTTEIDGMPLIEGTFEHAEQMPGLSPAEQQTGIERLLSEWTRTAPGPDTPRVSLAD